MGTLLERILRLLDPVGTMPLVTEVEGEAWGKDGGVALDTEVPPPVSVPGAAFSDIHVEEGQRVMVRRPRGWATVADWEEPVRREEVEEILATMNPNWEAHLRGGLALAHEVPNWRLRVKAYWVKGNRSIAVTLRCLPHYPPALGVTGLPSGVRLLLNGQPGLILVSGPTGAGKSTSIASMVEYINDLRAAHVVTIEDPIEYVFERRKAIFSQREVGLDCESFHLGLADALRQRPDVIVIGEIRDRETMATAMEAANSGHLVLASLHSKSASAAVQKVLSWFTQAEREAVIHSLELSLLAVLHQLRLPTIEGHAVLAVESLFNHKQQLKGKFRDPAHIEAWLRSGSDRLSISLDKAVGELVAKNLVSRDDAFHLAGYSPTAGV